MACVIVRDFIIHYSRFIAFSGALSSWQSFVIKLSEKSLQSATFGSSERLFHINAGVIV